MAKVYTFSKMSTTDLKENFSIYLRFYSCFSPFNNQP